MLTVGIDEKDILRSYIVTKKKDARLINVMPFSYIEDLNPKLNWKSDETHDLKDQDLVRNINYASFNLNSLKAKFCANLSRLFFCSDEEHIILQLQEKKQIRLNFLEEKKVRKIYPFSEKEFIFVTAQDCDTHINFLHSCGNKKYSLEIRMRYEQGLVSFNDFNSFMDPIS